MNYLFNKKMLEGGFVADHFNEFNTLTSQLCYAQVNFEDEVRALLILCSFPKIWSNLVMVVSNSIPSSWTLKFDDVVGIILNEEMKRKDTCDTSGNALNMERRRRKRERGKIPCSRKKSRKGCIFNSKLRKIVLE